MDTLQSTKRYEKELNFVYKKLNFKKFLQLENMSKRCRKPTISKPFLVDASTKKIAKKNGKEKIYAHNVFKNKSFFSMNLIMK